MRRSYARVDPRFSLCRSALVFFAAVLTVMAAAGPAGANYPRHVHFKTGGFPAGFVANVTVQSGSHCAENSDHLNIRASGTTKTTSWTFTVVNDTVGCFFSFSSFRYEISIGEELTIHGTRIFDQEAETHVRVEQIAPNCSRRRTAIAVRSITRCSVRPTGAELSTSEWSPKVEAAGDGDGVPELKEQRTVAHLNA